MTWCHPLRCPIMHYDWGSPEFIPALRGEPNPEGRPWAELWAGAHPKAPAELPVAGTWTSLDRFIAANPEAALGRRSREHFGDELPFLVKILAAARPLSIQVHPDAPRARAGFEREEAAGTPIDAPERSFRDPRPKPELIYALTPFRALCGFHSATRRRELLERLGPVPGLEGLDHPSPRKALATLLAMPAERRPAFVEALVGASPEDSEDPGIRCIGELARHYPGDLGVAMPLLLELHELSPGDALFLSPGVIHAYLGGAGIEVMASSDNVVRAGLTPKPVDPELLLELVNDNASEDLKISATRVDSSAHRLDAGCEAFLLERWELPEAPRALPRSELPEIWLSASGELQIAGEGSAPCVLPPGGAAFLSANRPAARISGGSCAFRVRPGIS